MNSSLCQKSYSLIQHPNFYLLFSAEKRWLPSQPKLPYHQLGTPQKRRTPCCISLLQQGGFHTTGILQTNRNTWIQGTRKTFKSSESYTISRKITTYHIVARQFSALGAGCRRFESCHSDQSPLKSEDFRGLFFGYCGAKFEGLTDDAFP